jgi:two-component system sensor histidine kinase QseC
LTSIRQRLTRNLLLLLGVLLGGGLAVIYYLVRDELIEGFDNTLLAKAQAISTLVTLDGETETLNFSDKFMRGFGDAEAKYFFEIWREDGVSLQRSESLDGQHLPNRVGTFAKPAIWALMLPRNQPGRALGVEFVPRGTNPASTRANTARFHLVVAARSRGADHELEEVLMITMGSGISLLAMTAFLVPWFLKRGLRPLEQLAAEAEKINAETLTLRFPTDGMPRELLAIAERLNALLVRLEQSFERERRVSAALAHELRTPIAELRNLAECALKWPDSRDPETDRDALAIARQMEAVVTHMLTLARSETGQLRPALEAVDLAQAVTQAWKPLLSEAEEKGCRLQFQPVELRVKADPVLLHSILGNLLENAVEYSPVGAVVEVALANNPDSFSLTVSNPAPDLTREDIGRLFERFWRKEQARSGGLHAGMGLSLVRSFARVLGWEVTARLESGAMLAIRVSGPRNNEVSPGA